MRYGIEPWRSQCVRAEIWLHHPRLADWARRHVSRRHQVDIEDVTVLSVYVQREWLVTRASGLWVVTREIEPGRIRGITFHGEPIAAAIDKAKRSVL